MDTATEDLLVLMQWLSPAYPVGAFSYSHGLEGAVDAGDLRDAAGLADWIGDVLRYGSGRADAVFLAAAYQAGARELATLDQTCRAFASSAERLKETALQGAAFAKVTQAVWGIELDNLCYPIAVGHAAAARKLPLVATSAAYLHAFASNLVSAGQRLLPVGQTDAQAMVQGLSATCAELAREFADGDLDRLSSAAFMADIAAMKHETQYSRIFRT